MTHIIRPIEMQDLPQAFGLLKDLIRQENIGRPLKMTLELMGQELFAPNATWYGLVAAQDTEIIGLCLYSIAHTSRPLNPTPLIQIDDFYVHPNFRRQKIGEKLIESLTKIAHQSGISRIELWCVKNNNMGQSFYQKMGAQKLDHIDVYRFNLDQ